MANGGVQQAHTSDVSPRFQTKIHLLSPATGLVKGLNNIIHTEGQRDRCLAPRCSAVWCRAVLCCAVPLATAPPVQVTLEVQAARCFQPSDCRSVTAAALGLHIIRGRTAPLCSGAICHVSQRVCFCQGPLQLGVCVQAGPGRSLCRPQAPCSSEGRGRAGSGTAGSGNAGGTASPLAAGTPPQPPGASLGLPPSDTAPLGLPGRCWHRGSLQALQTAQGKNFNSASDFNLKSEKMEKE